jgi:hypothetical protein
MADPRRRIRPAVESLEGRALLAVATSPTSPVPVHPEPITDPTNEQLGAAYRQILTIQESTYQGISSAHRRLYAAYGHLAALANPAVARDRRILQQGADLTARAEQGLVVARGVEDQTANMDKIYIPNNLFLSGLDAFVREAQTTGSNLVRSARRSTDAVVRQLDALAARLADHAGPRG